MEEAIIAKGLTKRFEDLTAVDAIDFEISRRECFGFLGPNGAGKTTTMQMIYGRVPITSGTLSVMGMDVRKKARQIKSIIGLVPQNDNLDPDLDVYENLIVYARYFDIPKKIAKERAEELLEFMQLTEKKKSKVDKLSGGLKRRLIVARALINSPRILILDEPTTGLDPQARHIVWEKLRQLKAAGTTMVLTTHYMEEAAHLCDRLIIMDRGKVITEGTPRGLVENHASSDVVEVWVDEKFKPQILLSLDGMDYHAESSLNILYLFTENGEELLHHIKQLKFPIRQSIFRKATLEDVFLKLTGRELRE